MRSILAVALLTLLPALPAAAQGAGWEASFSTEALRSSLPVQASPWVVARAGEPGDDLTAAATALINTAKAAGVAQVLDDTDLGQTRSASDRELLQRATTLGAKVLLVVRLTSEAQGSVRAVVTAYDAQGKLLATLSGHPAAQAAAPAPPSAPAPAPDANLRAAQARYAQEQLGFGSFAELSVLGVVPVEGPYEGSMQRRLSMPEFFEKVGRPDLAARYVTRASVRDALTVGGAAVVVLGLVTAGALLDARSGDCLTSSCSATHSDQVAAALAGGGGALLGGGLIAGGLLVDPMPVGDQEARDLARDHNQKLKASLGLSLRAPSTQGGPAVSLRVSF